MPTGFIYIVNTVGRDYEQPDFSCVPTLWNGRLYFGPCKAPMRPRMRLGDWIFGVSPSKTRTRRILFGAELEEVMTFADAYGRFPDLRGPKGPIPVKPVQRLDPSYARSRYLPIAGSSHDDRWELDVASPALDRFFVCKAPDGFRNRWLAVAGPVVDAEILSFFNRCPVFGQSANGTALNTGRPSAPIALGGFSRGLHLETGEPERLLSLCGTRINGPFPASPGPGAGGGGGGRRCGGGPGSATRRASSRC